MNGCLQTELYKFCSRRNRSNRASGAGKRGWKENLYYVLIQSVGKGTGQRKGAKSRLHNLQRAIAERMEIGMKDGLLLRGTVLDLNTDGNSRRKKRSADYEIMHGLTI